MFKRSIHLERIYPHSPERVWQVLTDPALVSKWLMKNDFKPEVGHRFHFQTKASVGFNGIVQCEVIEVDPPHRLAYTWKGGPLSQPTTVRWKLEPARQGTKLTLEHDGFEGVTGLLVSVLLGSGWQKMLNEKLLLILDGKEIPKAPVMLMKR
jgi:uncharacterized protein YndB with AHSA1/START domain